jgi:hypothetical protein
MIADIGTIIDDITTPLDPSTLDSKKNIEAQKNITAIEIQIIDTPTSIYKLN